MCPYASSSVDTIVAVGARFQTWPSIHQVDLPRAAQAATGEPPHAAARQDSPIWAAFLTMVTRSSHSAHAEPARPSRFDAGA